MAIVELILAAEAGRRASAAFRKAMREAATAPRAAPMPADDIALAALLAMDSLDFEGHVMSSFEKAGLYAVVTPRSNDFVDGYAARPDELTVVQCKRDKGLAAGMWLRRRSSQGTRWSTPPRSR